MKIAFPVVEGSLDSAIDARFGRAAGYLIVDSETEKNQFIPNPAAGAARGAGVAAAQVISSQKAEAVIVNSVGPNAFSALEATGMAIYQAPANSTVRELIEKMKAGELTKMTAPAGPIQGQAESQRRGRGQGSS
jgi:predicted Fe-Mo cluster-binding NifX family protein